jgi:hypothetical protein
MRHELTFRPDHYSLIAPLKKSRVSSILKLKLFLPNLLSGDSNKEQSSKNRFSHGNENINRVEMPENSGFSYGFIAQSQAFSTFVSRC